MNTPTPKVITEVIDKLSGLQAELRRTRDVANYGEDPEAAKKEAAKAEDCLRHLLDNPPARRKWTAKDLEDLRVRVLGEKAPLPTHLDMCLAVMEGLAAVVRPLPIHHLKALKAMMALRTAFRDKEEIAAGFTIGALKSMVAASLGVKETAVYEGVRDARARVYREVVEILCPYEEFLRASQPGADKGVASLTEPILSADAEQFDWVIHPFKKIRSKLEVDAEQRSAPSMKTDPMQSHQEPKGQGRTSETPTDVHSSRIEAAAPHAERASKRIDIHKIDEIVRSIYEAESLLRELLDESRLIDRRKAAYERLRNQVRPELEEAYWTINDECTENGPDASREAMQKDPALTRVYDHLRFHLGYDTLGETPKGNSLAVELEKIKEHLERLEKLRSHVRQLVEVADELLEFPLRITGLQKWRQELQRWAEADKPNDYHPKDGGNLGLLLGPRNGVAIENLLDKPFEKVFRKLEFLKDKTIDSLAASLRAKRDEALQEINALKAEASGSPAKPEKLLSMDAPETPEPPAGEQTTPRPPAPSEMDETELGQLKEYAERVPEPDIPGLVERMKTLRSALERGDKELIRQAKTDLKVYVGSIELMEDMLRAFQSRCGPDAHTNKHIEDAVRRAADIRAGAAPRYDWFWDKLVATEGVIAELERQQALKTQPQPALVQPPAGITPQEETKPKDCTHSDDFSSVLWYSVPYHFTATQASCAALLWAQWEKDPKAGLGLREKFIGEKISSSNENYRLAHTFRHQGKQHPAWGTMIHAKGDGFFYLGKPAAIKTPSKKRKK